MALSKAIRSEKNPEILKALLSYAQDHINQLQNELKKIKEKSEQDAQKTLELDDKLLTLQKMMFGKSSEKTKVDNPDRKRSDDTQIELFSKSLAPKPETPTDKNDNLEEITVDHKLTEIELADIAEEYGYSRESEWECLTGFYDESNEIDIKVESYVRKKHRRFKYRLKITKNSEKEIIVTAPNDLKIIPGATYSIDFSVEVLIKKYLYHLPLERIRRQMESSCLFVDCKTLYSLCFYVSMYLEGIVKKISEEINSCGLSVHMDETPWPINNSKQRDGYMWVKSNQAGSYYQFEPTRSGKVASEILGSYKGPVIVDGYGGYKSVFIKNINVNLCYCWAHARRKFKEIEQNYPTETGEVLELINRLFEIEGRAKDFEDLKRLRDEESKKIVNEIKKLLYETKKKTRGQSGLEKAINYTINHWSGLTKFLNNEKIPLSNNEAERTIRQVVMGRKNFHGSRTINGADTAATIYTIIESCKKVELDPKAYIKMVIENSIKKQEVLTPLKYAQKIRNIEVKTV